MRPLIGLLLGLALGAGGAVTWYETRDDRTLGERLEEVCTSDRDELPRADLEFVEDTGCNPQVSQP